MMDFRCQEAAHFGRQALGLAGLMARVAQWPPDLFWAATPADVAAVLDAWREDEGAGGVDRAELAAMMEQCPDG